MIVYPKIFLPPTERIDDVMLGKGQFRAVVLPVQRWLNSFPQDSSPRLKRLDTSEDEDSEKSGPYNDASRREPSSEVLRAEVPARRRRWLVRDR